MSLDPSFSSKKDHLRSGSPSSSSGLLNKSPSPSADSTPKSSPSKTPSKLSLKNLGRSTTGARKDSVSRSPFKRQQTVGEAGGKDKDKKLKGLPELGEYVPGTSGPSCVDYSPFHETSPQKQSTANKIIHNWKSACKDKTKDLIRKWKTLPESQQDFDVGRSGSPCGEKQSQSPAGSTCNIYTGPSGFQPTGASSPNIVDMVNPSQSSMGPGGSSGGASGGGSGSSATPPGKKTLGKSFGKKSDSGEITSGFQAMSLGGKGGSGSVGFATSNGPLQDETNGTKSKGWSVHVWATYVQRGVDDVTVNEDEPPARDFLSDFQKVKLTHFFRHVLDMNQDGVIAADDFVALNQRIRHYIEWSSECIEFHILKEVHSGFLECFLNQPLDDTSIMYYCNAERETRENVNIDEWLNVWGSLLNSARTLESLPLWLQYFPKILFQVINKSGSGTISREELRAFYTTFLGIDFRVVNDTLDSIYSAMTDNGRNKMTYTLFKLCFANFLLGKYPHGPGQYLFGICAPATLACAFPIDYSALNTPKDDLEPYDPEKDKGKSNRRSVIV